jgi:ATP-dependent protease ClpP protease subunit
MKSGIVAPLVDSEARILSLLGPMTPSDINLAVDHLLRLDGENAHPITLFVSSQGGGIVEALKMLDTFSLLQAPLTAVGLGFIEGAGSLVLAGASQRVLFPSALVSLAGLWELPAGLETSRRRVGLNVIPDQNDKIQNSLVQRVHEIIKESQGRIPTFFGDPELSPPLLNARDCIKNGLADAVIEGPRRQLNKLFLPQKREKQNDHAPQI